MDSEVSLQNRDSVLLVKLRGEAGVESAIALRERLLQAGNAKAITIDWSAAEHVETCVFQVLLAMRDSLSQQGGSLTVESDSPRVRGYLELSGLAGLFPVEPSLSVHPSPGAQHG